MGGIVTHWSVALEMFEVVRSESNACLLYGLLFKLPICKINKAQSDMCLNMPVVLLYQRASGPDADPWHFRPRAVGGKYYVQNKSKQYSVVLRDITFGRQVTTANLTTWCLFFLIPLFCQTKLWVPDKPLTPLWWKNVSHSKTPCQSVLIFIYSNV